MVVLGKFDPEAVLRLIETHKVTSTVLVPTHMQRLLALPEQTRARYDVSSLELVSQTGSACPPDTKLAMIEWFGPVFVESYGGSESGTLCRIDSHEWLTHRGSVGRPRSPYEVAVLDEKNQPVPTGQVGVLGFRAPDGRGPRYHGDPEKTAKAYLAPGVFTLGDVGYVDDDGYVFITDRIADMVVSGGVNLYPAESEKVLAGHPDVAAGRRDRRAAPRSRASRCSRLWCRPASRRIRPRSRNSRARAGAVQGAARLRVPHRADLQRDGQARQEGVAGSVLGHRPHHHRLSGTIVTTRRP